LVGDKPDLVERLCRTARSDQFVITSADLAQAPLNRHDVVLPLTLTDHAALTQRIAAGEGVRALLPSAEAVALCDDKLAFNQHLIRAGLGHLVPPLLPENAPPPFILKQRRDAWGAKSRMVTDPDEARRLRPGPEWFRQAIVAGNREYALHVLMQGGVPIYHRLITYHTFDQPYVLGKHQRPRSFDWSEGTEYLPALLPALQAVGWQDGLCCIDFKLQGDQPLLFEVNPRLGVSLAGHPNGVLLAYTRALAA